MSRLHPIIQIGLGLCIYLGMWACMYPWLRFRISPDGIAYLSIARYYGQGEWALAVNGLWSPLMCWVMAPFEALGVDLLSSFKWVNMCVGGICLCLIMDFGRTTLQLEQAYYRKLYYWGGVVYFSIVLSTWALMLVTPDLMHTTLLVAYASLAVRKQTYKKPLLTALIGAFLFFSKSIGFFFFAVHMTASLVLGYVPKLGWSRPALQKWRQYALIMGGWILLISPWLIALYQTYGTLTISNAGKYNHAMLVTGKIDHQWMHDKLFAPHHPKAVFPWEEITRSFTTFESWSPLSSLESFGTQLTIWGYNGLFIIQSFSEYLPVLVGAAAILLGLWHHRNKLSTVPAFDREIGLIFLMYTGGYALVFIEARYLWGIMVLLSVYAFVRLISMAVQFRLPTYVAAVVIGVCLVFRVVQTLSFVLNNRLDGKEYQEMAQALSKYIPPDSRLAGWKTGDSWFWAYYLDGHDYGGVAGYVQPAQMIKELDSLEINFVLIPENEGKTLFERQAIGTVNGIAIFDKPFAPYIPHVEGVMDSRD